jgi:hypothetical protein
MKDQYNQMQQEVDNVKKDPDFNKIKEQIISRYNVMEERIIVQQNEISKLNREVNRLKNYVDELQQQIRRRG